MWFIYPFSNYTGYSYLPDLLTRLNPNDAYLGTYYFFWTNLTYLPTLFFLLIFIVLLALIDWGIHSSWTTVLLIGLLLYMTELVEYLSLNFSDSISLYATSGLNTLLTNTLNRYHPLVFYTGVTILASFTFIKSILYLVKKPFVVVFTSRVSFPLAAAVSSISFLALWLGSWWALQEGTWGGWWNWDASETFGLLVPISILAFVHIQHRISDSTLLNLKSFLFALLITLSYFFIQLNFDLTSHNFGAKFFFFFNNNLFFLEALICIIITSFNLICLMSRFKVLNETSFLKTIQIYPLKLTVIASLTYWVFLSYQPLINYFLWNFAELNVFNYEPSFIGVNFFVMIILLFWLTSQPLYYIPSIGLLSSFITNQVWTLLIFKNKATQNYLAHFTLLTFTLLSWTVASTSFTTWITDSGALYTLFYGSVLLKGSTDITLDTYIVELSVPSVTSAFNADVSWNFLNDANTPAINYFQLFNSNSNLENYYTLGSSYSSSTLFVDLPFIAHLNSLFFIILFWSFQTLLTKVKLLNY